MADKSFCDCPLSRRHWHLFHATDEILVCDCGEYKNPNFDWKWDSSLKSDNCIVKDDQTVYLQCPDDRSFNVIKGDTPLIDGFEYFWEIKILNQQVFDTGMVN
mgnify:CR=1 FL=1